MVLVSTQHERNAHGFALFARVGGCIRIKAMPIRSNSRALTVSTGETVNGEIYFINYQNSLRVNGKLNLRANPMTLSTCRVSSAKIVSAPNGNHYYPIGAGSQCEPGSIPNWSWTPLNNEALARFRGRIRKGSASLGVTLASWKQSRDMIASRSNHLRKTLDSSYEALRRNPNAVKRLKREREPLANQVLETEFGWRPLFQDIYSALYTVCQDGIPPEWVRSRTMRPINQRNDPLPSSPANPLGFRTYYGEAYVTVAGKVSISNPNLYLLNRMGLINPGTVIWDLIPWSFVVNMFVNVNAFISQVTDEVGLSITDISHTRTLSVTMRDLRVSDPLNDYRGYTDFTYGGKWKDRTVGTLPNVKLEVKVPNLNWELALIASSLVVQKMKKINNLIRVI